MRHALLGVGDAAALVLQALIRRHQAAPAQVPGLPRLEPAPAPLPPLGRGDPASDELPWPASLSPQVVHLVFSPDELDGGALLAWIVRLRRLEPQARLELHADRLMALPADLQGESVACCWIPAPGQADAEAMAAWLLQRLAGDTPAEALASAAAGRLVSWALRECRADLVAVRQHLAAVLQQQWLERLRLGAPAADMPAEGPGLPAWPPSHELSLGPAQTGAMWQRLALHYQTLAARCEPERQAAELRRLFALGVHEGFDGCGVQAAMAADDARLHLRARAWIDELETRLWQDWSRGACSLAAVRRALQAARAEVMQQLEAARRHREQDEALAAGLQAALDRPVSGRGLGRWLSAGRGPDLAAVAHALQAWAQACTTAASSHRDERQVLALLEAVDRCLAAVEAADRMLVGRGEEAVRQARAALVAEGIGPQRLDRPELVQTLARTWVSGEGSEARQQEMRLRADLFLRFLGEGARFETLVRQLGDEVGATALREACERAIAAPVVASVAQSGVQWLARRWAQEPLREREMQALQPRLASAPAVLQLSLTGALRERLAPAAALLPALGARAAALAWLALSEPLDTVPEPAPQPLLDEPTAPAMTQALAPAEAAEAAETPTALPPPDWAPDLLLAEALDLLREGDQGWERAELDEFGLELALHPLGEDWPAMLDRLTQDGRERQQLLDALVPLRTSVPASARLREVIARRVAALGPAWQKAAQAALAVLAVPA
ncbi:MAG: hypothetical protein RLZZ592_1229 [Pseudomonadota bacterium]|jgi:hypothetical protein